MKVVEIRGLGFRENFQDGTVSNGAANGTQGGSIEVGYGECKPKW